MIKLKEGQKVYGTDGKQYLIERGDMVKTSIKEGFDNKLPYEVLVDGRFTMERDRPFGGNKSPRGESVKNGHYEVAWLNKNSDGSVIFRINIQTPGDEWFYSVLGYSSIQEARSDGWDL